jgi:hypothetical protein
MAVLGGNRLSKNLYYLRIFTHRRVVNWQRRTPADEAARSPRPINIQRYKKTVLFSLQEKHESARFSLFLNEKASGR